MLTKEQILSATDYRIEEISVPEWGGTIFQRSMSGEHRDRLEYQCIVSDTTTDKGIRIDPSKLALNYKATIVAWTVCDDKGKLLFTDKDIPIIGQRDGIILNRLSDNGLRLSGMRPEDLRTELKNFEAGHNGGSSSI